jgi:hypothetical protein
MLDSRVGHRYRYCRQRRHVSRMEVQSSFLLLLFPLLLCSISAPDMAAMDLEREDEEAGGSEETRCGARR